MDKRLILAVAGAGKTTYIINNIEKSEKVLLITYTENNYRILKDRLSKKFNGIPSNIYVTTYFSFLYSFCFLPFFFLQHRPKGLIFQPPDSSVFRMLKTNINRYITSSRYVYHCHLSDFLLKHNNIDLVLERIKRHFDYIYIDEVQDFASYDFDFILKIAKCDMNVLYLGDFYQHTFDTSNSGSKNKNLYNKGINDYINRFHGILKVDTETLSKSHRCKRNICELFHKSE